MIIGDHRVLASAPESLTCPTRGNALPVIAERKPTPLIEPFLTRGERLLEDDRQPAGVLLPRQPRRAPWLADLELLYDAQ